MPDPYVPSNPDGAGSSPSNPETAILSGIEQEQLNNFLGPVNGALGGLPVAERNSSYFITYKGAGGTGPEIIDQTAIFITNLIDSKGNISKPSEDYDSLYNLIQNFEIGKNVIVRNNLGSENNSQIEGKQKITDIGRQETILFSQTGSSEGANIDELIFLKDFDNDDIPSFLFWLNRGIETLGLIPEDIVGYNAPYLEPDVSSTATVDAALGEYTVGNLSSSPQGNIDIVQINIWTKLSNDSTNVINGSIRLMKDGSVFKQIPFDIGVRISATEPREKEINKTFSISKSDLDSATFKINVAVDNEGSQIDFINFRASTQFPQTSFPTPTPTYWENNNGNNLWLTASQDISLNYEQTQNSQNIIDTIEPGFNFSSPVPFIVRPGDKIRFGYDPTLEYIIYEVIEPIQDSEGRLRLRLNTLLPSTLNLDNFVLHRVNSNNPTYIIVDIKKNDLVPNTEEFEGILLPEYPTQELKDNLENIILNLKEKGILSNEN